MVSLLLTLNIVDFKQVNVCLGALSCVNIITLSLYSKSKDEQMLYLTSFKHLQLIFMKKVRMKKKKNRMKKNEKESYYCQIEVSLRTRNYSEKRKLLRKSDCSEKGEKAAVMKKQMLRKSNFCVEVVTLKKC